MYLLIFFILLSSACVMQGRGPLAVLEDWIHHLRASFLFLHKEVLPSLWNVRNRYGEWLRLVRMGRV